MDQQLFLTQQLITSSCENYLIYCRQYPQGAASLSPVSSVTTYTSRICRQPSSTILAIAVCSAHRLHTAFSTLQPPQYLPFAARTQTPTANLEQGQQAFERDDMAISCISFTRYSFIDISQLLYNKWVELQKWHYLTSEVVVQRYRYGGFTDWTVAVFDMTK